MYIDTKKNSINKSRARNNPSFSHLTSKTGKIMYQKMPLSQESNPIILENAIKDNIRKWMNTVSKNDYYDTGLFDMPLLSSFQLNN
jgi:hypothetical protein